MRVAVEVACRKPNSTGRTAVTFDLRFACLEVRQHALARWAREADLVAGGRQLGCRRRRELENGRGAIALHERYRESRQRRRPGAVTSDGDLAGLADDAQARRFRWRVLRPCPR